MKNSRRIDKWMVMMAIVCVAFLTGCGKSAKEGENVPDESKDNKEVVTESAEAQDESESGRRTKASRLMWMKTYQRDSTP